MTEAFGYYASRNGLGLGDERRKREYASTEQSPVDVAAADCVCVSGAPGTCARKSVDARERPEGGRRRAAAKRRVA